MPTVIPVKFQYATRDLWFDAGGSDALEGDHVICATERGTEIGLATQDPVEMDEERLRQTIGDARLKPVLRVADDEDLALAERLAEQGEAAFPLFRRLVSELGLDMKPIGVEYLFGGTKTICYFSADERVDFRQLVRDLSHELHQRIDMRQIGVREEAAIIGGYAHCGQELCCARFGRQFEPVSIRMAKEQDLPLNSVKISGACGRLMCCLRYEFEAYRDFKTRAPKRNAVIETPLGKGKIVEYDTPKEQVALRLESGKVVRVALADMETSEAAHKKSEELQCPCRPDTVPRAALDKLESPEIKMALAELDRKMGVLPQDSGNEEDLFVEPHRTRRRRRTGAQDAPSQDGGKTRDAQQTSREDNAGEQGSGRGRRRRRTTVGDADEVTSANDQASGSDAPQATTRRRRRHHQNNAETTTQPARQDNGGQAGTERPHGMQPKRRRRPGDKGGSQQSRPSQPKHAAPQAGAQDGLEQDGGAKRKRRRRRHGRGRGAGGDSGQATGAEG